MKRYPFFSVFLLVSTLMVVSCGGDGGGGTTPSDGGGGGGGTSSSARLSGIQLSTGALDQTFQSSLTTYTSSVGFLAATIRVTATTEDAVSTLHVKGLATASGSPSAPIALKEGNNTIIIFVRAANGYTMMTYFVDVTRQSASAFAQQAYVISSNTGTNDRFGYSVAQSGETLVVGAPGESSNSTGVNGPVNDLATASGAVYVFTRSAGVWSQQAYIKASNTGAGDAFGTSVTLSGDTLAVGAPFEDNNAIDSGALYVFTRSSGVWSQQAYIKAFNTDTGDAFGYSVALSGDTLAVGAYLEDSNGTGVNGQVNNSAGDAGAVYVFTRSAGVWSQQAYVKASNTDAGDWFGRSVAVSGDTLAVGADGEDSYDKHANGTGQANDSFPDSGAVYLFTRSAGVWSQQAYIKSSNTGTNDRFGYSVALSGDTLAVGAPGESSNGTGVINDVNGVALDNNSAGNAGAVYVLTFFGGVWGHQAYIKASNTEAGDAFGSSVAVSGDTLAVGAPFEDSSDIGVNGVAQADNSAGDAGAAYLFTRSGRLWSPQSYIKASNTGAGDWFGRSVTLSGDTLAIGADGENGIGTDSGALYVIH